LCVVFASVERDQIKHPSPEALGAVLQFPCADRHESTFNGRITHMASGDEDSRLEDDDVSGRVGAVDVKNRLLVIADIGGYTRFMLATRISLAHAQVAVTQLLEAVLDGAEGLELAKLEGDAAFFHAPVEMATTLPELVGGIRERFAAKKAQLVDERMCTCVGCTQLEALTLKFVAHSGEVAVHKVRHHEELAGIDVILVHRLLKNDVPIREYLLVTDAVLTSLSTTFQQQVIAMEHDLEGIGMTTTHYVASDVCQPGAAKTATTTTTKWWAKLVMEARSLPWLLGRKAKHGLRER